MEVRVLGASGSDMPGRHLPAFLVDGTVLLDAGTIGGVLTEKEQRKIRAVLLTHPHLDHLRALAFFGDNLALRGRTCAVSVRALPPVLRALATNILNDRVWPDLTEKPAHPVFSLDAVRAGRPFEVGGYRVWAHRVDHAVPAAGYVLEDRRGRRLLYTGDTGPTETLWKETARGIHCAIIECSLPNRMRKLALRAGHLTPALLGEEIRKMHRVPEQILISHVKPQYHDAVARELRFLRMKNLHVLRDGEVFEV
ncbi:MAG: 3',5'-cyclic-nucleotide phosphodiesterase [Nitrospirota bacterium]